MTGVFLSLRVFETWKHREVEAQRCEVRCAQGHTGSSRWVRQGLDQATSRRGFPVATPGDKGGSREGSKCAWLVQGWHRGGGLGLSEEGLGEQGVVVGEKGRENWGSRYTMRQDLGKPPVFLPRLLLCPSL